MCPLPSGQAEAFLKFADLTEDYWVSSGPKVWAGVSVPAFGVTHQCGVPVRWTSECTLLFASEHQSD